MVEVIQDGAVVSLAYTLRLANGEVIDYSEVDEPLEYLHGAENIIPGLERELTGMHVGESKEVQVEPAEGYGVYDPEDIEVVQRDLLPKNMPLKLGMVLAITDEEGNLSEAVVREISARDVTLDFNHPLAGQKLFFSVQVVGLREATEEELEHGHPHGDHDHEFDDFDDEDFEDLLDFEDEDYEDDEDFEDDEDISLKN
jgi:FKBP-type peptidyl-prolyl cis-trans isomerase SlyD